MMAIQRTADIDKIKRCLLQFVVTVVAKLVPLVFFHMIKMEKAKWSGFIDGPEGTKSIHKQVLLVAESSSSGVAC